MRRRGTRVEQDQVPHDFAILGRASERVAPELTSAPRLQQQSLTLTYLARSGWRINSRGVVKKISSRDIPLSGLDGTTSRGVDTVSASWTSNEISYQDRWARVDHRVRERLYDYPEEAGSSNVLSTTKIDTGVLAWQTMPHRFDQSKIISRQLSPGHSEAPSGRMQLVNRAVLRVDLTDDQTGGDGSFTGNQQSCHAARSDKELMMSSRTHQRSILSCLCGVQESTKEVFYKARSQED
ncbi:hypothetical protein RRG08_057833 [Elysia crispata]|uniref:Uncharacterized protein n=1 Tax=Elysia crispata TaxID=231223 RepID=A0AAE1AZ79_9GAST|nr:hypothetical protein RRG08_057833 [Elysia crispata]